jgi:hypothetical protein
MISQVLKMLPLLALGWNLSAAQLPVGASIDTPSILRSGKENPEMRCGVPEKGNCCMARSCSCAHGMAMQFNFLYWRAENHGFSYALNEKTGGQFSGNPDDGTPMMGRIMRVSPSWDPGFRFGIGYNSDHDRWDLFANWTYYHNHASETNVRTDLAGQTTFDGYYPLWPVATSAPLNNVRFQPFQTVHASWQMWHQAFDLELGRAYFLTKKFSLRPHIGGRGAWIRQKFYDQFSMSLQPFSVVADQIAFHGRNNWWGVGPRVGLEGNWHVGRGFSLLGRTAASALYGLSKVRFLSIYDVLNPPPVLNRRFSEVLFQVVPNFQLFLGAGWSTCLRRGQVFFGIDGGWEANYWWNQCNVPVALTQFTSPLPTVFNQPVTMEGLTVNLHLDY